MIRRSPTLIALWVLAASSSQLSEPATSARALYSGTILSFGSGAAVAGVEISAAIGDGSHATTSVDGRFKIERLSVPQHYTDLLAIEGVGPFLEIPELPSEPIDLGDLQVPEETLVRGSVVDAAGEPVLNALVALAPQGFEVAFRSKVFDLLWIHSRTAGGGEFEVTVPPGVYQVVVYAEGHAATQANGVQIGAGSEQRLDPLRLRASVEFGGRVTDRDDAPIPAVTVTTNVYPAGGIGASVYPKLESVTDARGCYRFAGIPPEASLNLRFTKPGYAPGWAGARADPLGQPPARVASGGEGPGRCGAAPDQVLAEAKEKGSRTPVPGSEDGRPANTVDVTVVTLDERGLPIPGAGVSVQTVDNQPLPKDQRIEADSGGRVRFDGVVPGRYRVNAAYRWGRGHVGVVTLDASRTVLNITATRQDATAAELTGRIGDGKGGPRALVARCYRSKPTRPPGSS